jgi:hypothetical protein
MAVTSSSGSASFWVHARCAPQGDLNGGVRDRVAVLERLYRQVDSASISHADRASGFDSPACTHFDTDAASFIQLLHGAGAANAQVFYDLGCGAGQSAVSQSVRRHV